MNIFRRSTSFGRRWIVTDAKDLPLTLMDKYFMTSLPFGFIGAGFGIREALNETKNADMYNTTMTGCAYGLFGMMIGCTAWCFSPVIVTVGGISYLHKKLSK